MEKEKNLQENKLVNYDYLKDKGEKVSFYIASQITEKGYIKASNNYKNYIPMWFRDSSFTSISLTHSAKFFELRNDKENADKIKDASARLLNFMWGAMNNFSENMDRAIEMPYENLDFKYNILNHVPARINEDGTMGSHRGNENITDTKDSIWLKQFDSVPLLIIATNEYIKNFGIDKNFENSLDNISKLLPKMIEYMNKIYITPCSNAWEMDTHQIHAYDVAAIYSGMDNALMIIEYFKNNLNNNAINGIDENKVLKYMGDVNKFLKDHFIRDNILYKGKDEFREDGRFKNGPVQEVDSEELFIFTRFKPPCATGEIQKNTMKKIEDDLFDNNVLPIRFKGDTYFCGGRWPLLGLEAANWYIENNLQEKAEKIIYYITKKYLPDGEMIPEQEIINPASYYDPDYFYIKNDNKVIEDLAWSESAYVDTVFKYLINQENREGNSKA